MKLFLSVFFSACILIWIGCEVAPWIARTIREHRRSWLKSQQAPLPDDRSSVVQFRRMQKQRNW